MNKRYIVTFTAVCLVIIMTTAFATAESSEKIVKNLIDIRTQTLNQYYQGEITREEAAAVIGEIESGNLKDKDLQNMEDYFQTDIERVKDYKISSVEITHEDEEMICADVYMQWEVEKMDNPGVEVKEWEQIDYLLCQYSTICQKEGNVYKLVQFF